LFGTKNVRQLERKKMKNRLSSTLVYAKAVTKDKQCPLVFLSM